MSVERGTPYDVEEVQKFLQRAMKRAVTKLAFRETNVVLPLIDGSPLTRSIWLRISHYLEEDDDTYHNLAHSCKSLYKVLCLDKIWYYVHPLKSKIMSTKVLRMPYVQVVQSEVPENFDVQLELSQLPTTAECEALVKQEMPEAPEMVIKSEVILTLLTAFYDFLLEGEVDEDGEPFEYEEDIEGAGIFTYYKGHRPLEFQESYKHLKVKAGKSSYLIMKPEMVELKSGQKRKETEQETRHRFSHSIKGYDGDRLIRLLKHKYSL